MLAELVEAHRAQTLHYLFLTGLQRAKLYNLGAPSVQHEFVSTKLTPALRRRMNVDTQRWSDSGPASVRFRQLLLELLDHRGLFLKIPLYYRALTHFFGGPEQVIREIPILRDGRHVTTQRAHLLGPVNAFKLTALDTGLNTVEEHLHRFLRHTELDAIHWVNLYHHEVRFVTTRRKK